MTKACLVSCLGIECPQKTKPVCIRYIIGVLCYNFKSQMNILALCYTLACVKAKIKPLLRNSHFS